MVEALITVVILSVVGLSVASSLHEMFRQNRSIGAASDYNELINEYRTILTDGPLCTAALQGVLFTNGPVVLNPPLPVTAAGGAPFNGTVDVVTLKITGVTDLSQLVAPTACVGNKPCCNPAAACNDGTFFRKTGFIYLLTDFNNPTFSSMGTSGPTSRGMYVPVYVDTNAAGNVVSCLGKGGDGPRQLCFNLTFNATAPSGIFNGGTMQCTPQTF